MRQVLIDITRAACEALTNFISKSGSRKFIILLIATHAMYGDILPPEYWTMVAMAWMGVHGGAQAIQSYRLPDIRPEDRRRRDDGRDFREFGPDPEVRGLDGIAVQ